MEKTPSPVYFSISNLNLNNSGLSEFIIIMSKSLYIQPILDDEEDEKSSVLRESFNISTRASELCINTLKPQGRKRDFKRTQLGNLNVPSAWVFEAAGKRATNLALFALDE